jgi:hypothetical protein
VVKSSAKVALQDWNNALPYLLIAIEMGLFAVLHFWGFPWRPYAILQDKTTTRDAQCYQGGRLGLKALIDAMNPWDLVKANARGLRWLFSGRKKRTEDPSYELTMREVSRKVSSESRGSPLVA